MARAFRYDEEAFELAVAKFFRNWTTFRTCKIKHEHVFLFLIFSAKVQHHFRKYVISELTKQVDRFNQVH